MCPGLVTIVSLAIDLKSQSLFTLHINVFQCLNTFSGLSKFWTIWIQARIVSQELLKHHNLFQDLVKRKLAKIFEIYLFVDGDQMSFISTRESGVLFLQIYKISIGLFRFPIFLRDLGKTGFLHKSRLCRLLTVYTVPTKLDHIIKINVLYLKWFCFVGTLFTQNQWIIVFWIEKVLKP